MYETGLQVICFGAINLDYIFEIRKETASILGIEPHQEYVRKDEELDPILKILNKEGILRYTSGGGSAANTAFALSRLGIKTGFIGKVGNDKEGDFLLNSFENVDKGGINRGGRSGVALCLLIRGERAIILFPNANDELSMREINKEYASSCKILHLTSFNSDGSFEAQKALVASIRPEIKVSFDPGALYARRGLEALMPILRRTEIFFPEKKELEILTKKPWKEGALEILNLGPKVIVVTAGGEGSYVLTKDEDFKVDATKVPVIDTTGAGDVYAGAFLASYIKGMSLRESALNATALAAQSITAFGRERYPKSVGNLI
ncbi:MAG: carbohydrate kinase family protein [Nitrospirota bacterium]